MPFDNAGNRYPTYTPNGADIAMRDSRRGGKYYLKLPFGEVLDAPTFIPIKGFDVKIIARRLHQIHRTPMLLALEQARRIAYDSNSIFPASITLHFRSDWGTV